MSDSEMYQSASVYVSGTRYNKKLGVWNGNWLCPIAVLLAAMFFFAYLIPSIQMFPDTFDFMTIKATGIVYSVLTGAGTLFALLVFGFFGNNMNKFLPYTNRLFWIAFVIAALFACVYGSIHIWVFYIDHPLSYMTDHYSCAAINAFSLWQSVLRNLSSLSLFACGMACFCAFLLYSPEQWSYTINPSGGTQ